AAVPNAIEVQAGAAGQHEELVGNGERNVTIGIGEQLRELGFHRLQMNNFGSQFAEQLGGSLGRFGSEAAYQLGQGFQFDESSALCDPFGAECDSGLTASLGQIAADPFGCAGIQGRPEDNQVIVGEDWQRFVQPAADDG